MTARGPPADVGDSKTPLLRLPYPHSPTRKLLPQVTSGMRRCVDEGDIMLNVVTKIAVKIAVVLESRNQDSRVSDQSYKSIGISLTS